MTYKIISLGQLRVNQANDRHGELVNETAAIGWLFTNHQSQMKNLARDIVQSGEIYEPPLVYPSGNSYIVFDGNRRTTCLKLLISPNLAPSIELQKFFTNLRKEWQSPLPHKIMCQVETNRDKIDEILFRRHTGSQSGVGQSNWNGRMKTTFINRTGKSSGLNIADEIEERLKKAGMLPERKPIPRSNLNRLLSAEAFRNRVGITIIRGKFQYNRKESSVLRALSRITDDLAHKRVTLDDVWDVERKSKYLDILESEGVLPTAADAINAGSKQTATSIIKKSKHSVPKTPAHPEQRKKLILQMEYGVAWAAKLQRHRAIWEELQFNLDLNGHLNAISVLCRVLLELSVDNYLEQSHLQTAKESDALVKKIIACAEDMQAKSKINKRYLQVIRKAQNMDAIISVDTLNKYVHSSKLAPAPDHLVSIWDTFSEFIVRCLNE